MFDVRRFDVRRYRGAVATALVACAFGVLFAIPTGDWGGGSAAAAYYYYSGGGTATLTLVPASATNTVGTTHTLTATVTQDTHPLAGVIVEFSVTGSVVVGGSCTTDISGHCTFTYTGPSLPGADLITAFADTNGNGTGDAGEPVATATKAWVLPLTTPGQVTGGGQIAPAGRSVTFGFTAKSDSHGPKGECTVVDRDAKRTIKCLDVTALVQSGNTASIYGNANDDGIATTYVMQIADNGEPGAGKDTFSIHTGDGYSASDTLTAGNIQTH